MFDLERAIIGWRRHMIERGITSPEVLDELESHLREALEPGAAFRLAVETVGEPGALKAEFNKVPPPSLGWKPRLKRALFGWMFYLKSIPENINGDPLPDNLDPNARLALAHAHAERLRFHHDFVGTEHVLLGLLRSRNGQAANIIQKLGVSYEAVRRMIENEVGRGPILHPRKKPLLTPRARKALELAATEARALKQPVVNDRHLLLGLLVEGSGVAALVLKKLGIDPERIRAEIRNQAGFGS